MKCILDGYVKHIKLQVTVNFNYKISIELKKKASFASRADLNLTNGLVNEI